MSSSKSTPKYTGTYYSVGKETHKLQMQMFADNRQKLVARLKKDHPDISSGLIFLMGGKQPCRYSSDTDIVFRQESFFQWAFGVRDADIYGVIDVANGEATLIIPKYPSEYVVWFGEIRETDHYLRDYNVEHCIYEEDMAQWFTQRKEETIYWRLVFEFAEMSISGLSQF